jgi:hypothetical protein
MNINGYFCNERQIYAMTTILDLKDIYKATMSESIDDLTHLITIVAGQNKSLELFTYSDEFGAYLRKDRNRLPVSVFWRIDIEIPGLVSKIPGRKVMLI